MLMNSSSSILSFMEGAFGVVSKMSLPNEGHLDVSPMLSSRSSMVSVLQCCFLFVASGKNTVDFVPRPHR